MISGFYVTTKGQNYITRAMSDRSLVFTRGEFGNGIFPVNTDPRTMTALVNKLGNLPVSEKTAEGNTVVVTTQFSNLVNGSILPGFKLTEVALYGKLQTYSGAADPDGPEALLFYGYTTEDKADYIDAILTEYLINFPLTTSSSATVEIVIDESLVYITKDEFKKEIDELGVTTVLENVPLSTSQFSEDTTYEGYPYKAVVPIEGITNQYIASVIFAPAEADSGTFATIAATQDGEIVLYARTIPAADIVIPTIECRLAKSTVDFDDDPGSGSIDGDIATDEEVDDAIDDVFGDDTGDEPGGDVPGGDIATDEEVDDAIDDIFGGGDDTGGGEDTGEEPGGSTDEPGGDDTTGEENPDGDVATDEEVKDVIDDIFG